MMKRNIVTVIFSVLTSFVVAQNACDEIQFGDLGSESKHAFSTKRSEIYYGGLNESARRLLPLQVVSWEGGTMAFKMKVDPKEQNYFTIRCFGTESDRNLTMLFIEGLQIGYRHLGDIDYLTLGNGESPFVNRFYYVTLPLPIRYTKGQREVNLEIRSYGPIWGYGETFERYQKNMIEPTVGFYKAYTHTQTCFVPDKKEKQGEIPVYKIRKSPNIEVLDQLKVRVNNDLKEIMEKEVLTSQLEMWTLAEAYSVNWTVAYQNRQIVDLIARSIDQFYTMYKQQPSLVYGDSSVYNNEWLIAGPIARAIRMLWGELQPNLTVERKSKWIEIMQAALAYSTMHRRHYTNQSMIIDLFMYDVNKTLTLLDPLKALPEFQTLKYLYESVGLCP